DPAAWKHYGWSIINDDGYRRRYERLTPSAHSSSSKRSLIELDAYLAAVLHRAQKFQEALDAISNKEPPVMLLAIGGDCDETLNAPVMLRDMKNNRWLTLIRPRDYRTSTGERITSRQATAAMFAPGDGRVTRRSLLGEDLPGMRRANATVDSPLPLNYAVFAC